MSAKETTPDTQADSGKTPGLWNDGKPILVLPARPNITVRHFRHDDAVPLQKHCDKYSLWINLRDRFPRPYTLEDAQKWVNFNFDKTHWVTPGFSHEQHKTEDDSELKVPNNFVICENDQVIGAIGLEFGSDVERRTAELGYWLAEEHAGKGIMTDVAVQFIEWSFRTFEQLIRLEAGVYGWNTKSLTVLQKCGFAQEGLRRCACWKAGKAVDQIILGRVREGYEGTTEQPKGQ